MGCIRQHFRPSKETITRVPGVGKCWECIPHEDNKNCRMYYPITGLQEFEVKEKEECRILNRNKDLI